MTLYKIVERPREGMIVTNHLLYGTQIWAVSRMTVKHKGDACAMCGAIVGEKAFRPLTNLSNRMMRICLNH